MSLAVTLVAMLAASSPAAPEGSQVRGLRPLQVRAGFARAAGRPPFGGLRDVREKATARPDGRAPAARREPREPAAGGAREPANLLLAPAPLTFFIGAGERGTGFRAADRDLAAWAFESWARESRGGLTLQPAVEDKARIRLLWVPLGSNLFGEMRRILVDGEPGAAVYVLPDLDALGPDISSRARQDPLWRDTIVYLTCVHEIGHALGLPHTADERDIMYSFGYGGDIVEYFMRYRRKLKARADMRTASALSDSDVKTLRTLHPAAGH